VRKNFGGRDHRSWDHECPPFAKSWLYAHVSDTDGSYNRL